MREPISNNPEYPGNCIAVSYTWTDNRIFKCAIIILVAHYLFHILCYILVSMEPPKGKNNKAFPREILYSLKKRFAFPHKTFAFSRET